MVKKISCIFILFFLTNICFAQNGFQKISLDKLMSSVKVSDLIKDIPSDCKISNYEVSLTNANGLHSVIATSDSIGKYFVNHLPTPKAGNKIFISLKSASCLPKIKKEYKFLIEMNDICKKLSPYFIDAWQYIVIIVIMIIAAIFIL
jgi:hypothetical protein